jgi:ubiquinone/menaquinone biosynthesis C-methylase UbiE
MTMRLTATPSYSRLAPHYDQFAGHAQFRQVRRIFDHCVLKHGLRFSRVADFGCGSGLFIRYLASRWPVRVYAVDRSPWMLTIAARRCRGLPCTLLLRDYRKLVLPLRVDLITMFSFTLNLEASPATLGEVLDSVWRNLLPGGCWIADFLTPHQIVTDPRESAGASARILCQTRERVCLGIGIRSQGGTKIHEERHCARLLPAAQLRDQLDQRGFVLMDALDYASLRPAQHASSALVFVVRKPGVAAC